MKGQVASLAEIYRDSEKVDPLVYDYFSMMDRSTVRFPCSIFSLFNYLRFD
jgi:hypothetical protein